MAADHTVCGHAVFTAIRHLPLIAGIGYSLAWAIGLSVFSSSTEVRITGTQVVGLFAGHEGAVATQYVMAKGVPALCLAWLSLPYLMAFVTTTGILLSRRPPRT